MEITDSKQESLISDEQQQSQEEQKLETHVESSYVVPPQAQSSVDFVKYQKTNSYEQVAPLPSQIIYQEEDIQQQQYPQEEQKQQQSESPYLNLQEPQQQQEKSTILQIISNEAQECYEKIRDDLQKQKEDFKPWAIQQKEDFSKEMGNLKGEVKLAWSEIKQGLSSLFSRKKTHQEPQQNLQNLLQDETQDKQTNLD